DVQADIGVADARVPLALGQEPVGDAALIEHLERARVQAAGPGACPFELARRASFDDRDVDAGQGQLGAQHHPGRAGSRDDDRVFGRDRHPRIVSTPRALAASPTPRETIGTDPKPAFGAAPDAACPDAIITPMTTSAGASSTPPVGTVTFLFSDIEGSTRLLEQLGNGYATVLQFHRTAMRRAFAEHGGVER